MNALMDDSSTESGFILPLSGLRRRNLTQSIAEVKLELSNASLRVRPFFECCYLNPIECLYISERSRTLQLGWVLIGSWLLHTSAFGALTIEIPERKFLPRFGGIMLRLSWVNTMTIGHCGHVTIIQHEILPRGQIKHYHHRVWRPLTSTWQSMGDGEPLPVGAADTDHVGEGSDLNCCCADAGGHKTKIHYSKKWEERSVWWPPDVLMATRWCVDDASWLYPNLQLTKPTRSQIY